MPQEKVIWVWPKSGVNTILELALLFLVTYLFIKIAQHYSDRAERSLRNWRRLDLIASKRGLRLRERRLLYYFFHQLTADHRDKLFLTKQKLSTHLYNYLANTDGKEAHSHLELISKLTQNRKQSLRHRLEFRGIEDIESNEIIAFRYKQQSGLALVREKQNQELVLSIKSKKHDFLPSSSKMQAIIYRPGVGLIFVDGLARKTSQNGLVFSIAEA